MESRNHSKKLYCKCTSIYCCKYLPTISSKKTQLFSITVKFLGSRGFCDDPFIVPDLSVIIAIIAFLLQLKMQWM